MLVQVFAQRESFVLTKRSDYSFECLSAQLEAKKNKIKEQREQKAKNVAKKLIVSAAQASRSNMFFCVQEGAFQLSTIMS